MAMRFGLFYEWPNPDAGDWRRLFEESIEQIQYSEELGFDFVLVAEHHFSNYGMSPAPLLQALAIAERTRRLQIATAVLVLPEWQPLRLAEEVAVLDNLTGGRFACGIGRGYQSHEMSRLGVALEESRVRFNETLDVLIRAWTCDESFTYHGDYITVEQPTVVWPKPYQKPHPPLWIAGTSAETMRLAAEREIVPITTGFVGAKGIRDAAAVWVRTRAALGRPITGLELGLQAMSHVTDTDGEAWADLRYARWQIRANRALQRQDVPHGRVNPTTYEGEPDDDAFWNTVYYGSPETVIARLRGMAAEGATFVSNWMMHGGMEHEKIMRSIRLMGEEVIPALRDARPPDGLAEELAAAAVEQDVPPLTRPAHAQ
jgi:alkanesulfonate monooxygenase SsuD/methylene tetrahydromethanopterin reductase-like flavin-dependent oxidoreductase (luciferase family)